MVPTVMLSPDHVTASLDLLVSIATPFVTKDPSVSDVTSHVPVAMERTVITPTATAPVRPAG